MCALGSAVMKTTEKRVWDLSMRHVAQRMISLLDLVSSENSNLTVCLRETRGSCLRYLVEQKVMSCIVNTRNLVFIEMMIFCFALYRDVIDTFFHPMFCHFLLCVI